MYKSVCLVRSVAQCISGTFSSSDFVLSSGLIEVLCAFRGLPDVKESEEEGKAEDGEANSRNRTPFQQYWGREMPLPIPPFHG